MTTRSGMDLSYPPEAEEFRKEIRTWLEVFIRRFFTAPQ